MYEFLYLIIIVLLNNVKNTQEAINEFILLLFSGTVTLI
jgi:hypothetical protein